MNDMPTYAKWQSGHTQNMMIGVSNTLVGTNKSRKVWVISPKRIKLACETLRAR